MPIDTRAISQILQSYQSGIEQKMGREALALKAKAQSEEMALREQERQDKVKQFEQRMKLDEEREKRILAMAQAANDLAKFNAKESVIQSIGQGKRPGNLSVPGRPVAQGLPTEFAVPSVKGDIDLGPIGTISANEWQTPAEAYEQNPTVRLQKELTNSRSQQQMALELLRQSGATARQESAQEFKAGESKLDRELQKQIAEARNRTTIAAVSKRIAANDARDKGKALVEIRSFRNSPINAKMGELAGDVKIAKDYLRNPSKMVGLNDLQLAYKFIRSQDPNAVKGDEMKLLRDNANPVWDQVGMKGRNFLANEKNMFTTEGRKKMLQIIIDNNNSRFEQYRNLRQTIFNNVKELAPDMATDEHIPNAIAIAEFEDVDDATFNQIKERLNATKNKK